MAPNRRKGSKKGISSADVTRRDWKVGDLVLAKVKGFPAWPATVSEPEKWGYPADLKKILVYFFGTKQIAFCNPADVEAFTEEKKQTLLVKRQGKGVDFVKALQEIIDIYENSKKKKIGVRSGDEITETNALELVDLENNHVLKSQTNIPTVTLNFCLKSSCSTKDRSKLNLFAEDVAASNTLIDRETMADDQTDNGLGTKTPTVSSYSSKKETPSVRRSRSSSRIDFCRIHSYMMPSSDGNKSSGDLAVNLVQDGSLRWSRGSSKLPDVSACHNVDLSPFLADGSIEDGGSEIATLDSDTRSLNEGSTIESGCMYDEADVLVECLEKNIVLCEKLNIPSNAVIAKKKRKPNRKRANNDGLDIHACSSGLVGKADLELQNKIKCKGSPIVCITSNLISSKEDGDEHLPLVKRARVRMGKSSYVEENDNNFIQTAKKTLIDGTSLTHSVSVPDDKYSSAVKNVMDSSSHPNNYIPVIEHIPAFFSMKKNKTFGCLVDGEATLPPSKRLQRALEAMSANAAEDDLLHIETPSSMEVVTNGVSPARVCSRVASKVKTLKVPDVESCLNAVSQVDSLGFSTPLNSVISKDITKSSLKVNIGNQSVLSTKGIKGQFCKDMHPEVSDFNDAIVHGGLSLGRCTTQIDGQVQNVQLLSCNLDRKLSDLMSNEDIMNKPLLSNVEGQEKSFSLSNRDGKADKPCKEFNIVECIHMSPSHLSPVKTVTEVSSYKGTDLLLISDEHNHDKDTKILKPQLVEDIEANGMCEVVKTVEHRSRPEDRDMYPCSESLEAKIPTSSVTQHLSYSPVVYDDKDISRVLSTFSQTLKVGSPSEKVRSSSDSSKFLQNNGCYSSDLLKEKSVYAQDYKEFEPSAIHRPKIVDVGNICVDAHPALKSFEAMLGTLTRTKESIGNLTRIAIDCARHGVAAEVVEMLARYMETESKLYRRVNFFFLVDSITQRSRGLKGDVRGIYPSSVQAMLPRIVSAACPPGKTSQENRRECLKVLRLWLERRIFPEAIICQHMRELDSCSGLSSVSPSSHRSSRIERAFHDPIREMDGLLVDEYGSNSSFQLSEFNLSQILKDENEENDSDGGHFEAVTPEHNSEIPEERISNFTSPIERHTRILEDVDGELEMEDVSPSCEDMNSSKNITGGNNVQGFHHQHKSETPLPCNVAQSSPSLPVSPSVMANSFINGGDSKHHIGTHTTDRSQQPFVQQSSIQRTNQLIKDSTRYHAPQHRDFQRLAHISDPMSSCFNSFCRPPKRPMNNFRSMDNGGLHRKAYHLRPPHHAPSNLFSYGKEPMPPHRESQPRYSNRYNFAQNTGRGNFYRNHSGLEYSQPELSERANFSASSFSVNVDRGPYTPTPFSIPTRDSARIGNQRWSLHSRGMNHRNFVPIRPPHESSYPPASRATHRL